MNRNKKGSVVPKTTTVKKTTKLITTRQTRNARGRVVPYQKLLMQYANALNDPFTTYCPPLGYGVLTPLVQGAAYLSFGVLTTQPFVVLILDVQNLKAPGYLRTYQAGTASGALSAAGIIPTPATNAAGIPITSQARVKCGAIRANIRYPQTGVAPQVYAGSITDSLNNIETLTFGGLIAHPRIRPVYPENQTGGVFAQCNFVPSDPDQFDLSSARLDPAPSANVLCQKLILAYECLAGMTINIQAITQAELDRGVVQGSFEDVAEPEATFSEQAGDFLSFAGQVIKHLAPGGVVAPATMHSPILGRYKDQAGGSALASWSASHSPLGRGWQNIEQT